MRDLTRTKAYLDQIAWERVGLAPRSRWLWALEISMLILDVFLFVAVIVARPKLSHLALSAIAGRVLLTVPAQWFLERGARRNRASRENLARLQVVNAYMEGHIDSSNETTDYLAKRERPPISMLS